MTKPTILTQEQMRPGQDVERHLRKFGHLPSEGSPAICHNSPYCEPGEVCKCRKHYEEDNK